MTNANTTVDAKGSLILAKFTKLRSATFGLGGTIGADFTVEAAWEWKARRFAGLASACFNLAESLKDVPGSYDVHFGARCLATLCADYSHG